MDYISQFAGYDGVIQEIRLARKYNPDLSADLEAQARLIARLHPPVQKMRVLEVIQETPTVKTFRLVPQTGFPAPFLAGQYINLTVEVQGIVTGRPYTISSPPTQRDHYDITVREVPGGLVSGYLHQQVGPGDCLDCSGPAGHFHFNPLFHDPVSVFIAGGCGLTPFISMIRQMADRSAEREIYLFYGHSTVNEALFHDELVELAERTPGLTYVPVVEQPPPGYQGCQGLVSGRLLQETLGDLTGKTYYLCGPQGLYNYCLNQLGSLGVPRRKIRTEVYGLPPEIWKHPAWPDDISPDNYVNVYLSGGGSVPARCGETLLTALEKEGYRPPSLCRSGQCSLCRVRLVSGLVFQPEGVWLRKSDRENGWIHSCAAFPLTDVELLI